MVNDASSFNVNGPGVDNGCYFGFPFTADESDLVLFSVPWDVTSSYGGGASMAPRAMIGASVQIDLYDASYPEGWKHGIATLPVDNTILKRSESLRKEAEKIIAHLEAGGSPDDRHISALRDKINKASRDLNENISRICGEWLDKGKLIGLVGGDHSVPFGYMDALASRIGTFGILHLDAHCDLRNAYEGFDHSHASIMHNVMRHNQNISSLVQVGIRDFCEEEVDYYRSDERITVFTDTAVSHRLLKGGSWDSVCEEIVSHLPDSVYVSFDIDGLSPDNCPNTGTPVPGGLSFNEAVYLLNKIVESGRPIVGFDLCEVTPRKDSEWDANVGSRILYKLCNLALKSK